MKKLVETILPEGLPLRTEAEIAEDALDDTYMGTKKERESEILWIWDVYKDVNGIRPRHLNFDSMTLSQLRKMSDDLARQSEIAADWAREDEVRALNSFEESISSHIDAGAGDRETALRWVAQSHNLDARDVERLAEELTFDWGLPWDKAKECAAQIKAAVEGGGGEAFVELDELEDFDEYYN